MVHSFGAHLAESMVGVVRLAFDRAYERRWPGCALEVVSDRERQKAGVDVVVTLADGWETALRIDEKLRPSGDYDDLLVEEWSDRDRAVPGWTVDPEKRIDLIAYASKPRCECWLLPARTLRSVCQSCLPGRWADRRRIEVVSRWQGREWTTVNVAVPWAEILPLLGVERSEVLVPWMALAVDEINWGMRW